MLKQKPLALLLSSVLFVSPLWAAGKTYELKIPQQSLQDALAALAHQSGLEIVYESSLVAGRTSPEVQGALTAEQALQRLLSGTGLHSRFINEGAIAISPETASPATPRSGSGRGESQGSASGSGGGQPAVENRPPRSASMSGGESGTLDAVMVTGTRIRGGVTPSPVITLDAERIREEGFSDMGEVIRSIPQNYSGGQNPGVVNGQLGSISNANFGGGSGLNLRGLGPDGTLTLLNGRRLPYGGLYQSVDVSAIPVEAVQRIEIVADGASAIYGSDAVGGVGNVILKRDFEGLRLGARYGAATDGGMATREYTATSGMRWNNGGAIVTLRDVHADPIYADQRDYTRFMRHPATIYSGYDTRSGLVSAFQALGDVAELKLDAFRSKRDLHAQSTYPAFMAHVKNVNDASFVSPSLDLFLPNDWTIAVGAGWGRDEVVSQAVYSYPNGTSALLADTSYRNENQTYDIGAEGRLFAVGGGDVRLAVGVGYRNNGFRELNYLTSMARTDAEESSRFAYAEVNLPLIAEPNRKQYAHRLSLTAAFRGEDYDSFGRVTTPKLGVIYGPSADFTLKASWGKSFKAPMLEQLHGPRTSYLDLASAYAAGFPSEATVLEVTGANSSLNPERATTWTASVAFHPEAMPGLDAQLSWFDIDYTDKVLSPINTRDALLNPMYAPFIIFSPTPEQQAAAIAPTQFINHSGLAYDPAAVIALMDRRQTNVSRQHIRGVDLSAGYGFAVGGGRLTLRGSTSWLDSEQQTLASQATFDLSGRIFHPAKYKSRIGAVWSRGGFTASGFANYIAGVINTTAAEKTGSFATLDATLRYRTGSDERFWSNMDISLSASNLLNRAPPRHTSSSLTSVHFDSTNYSAIGRFMNVSISKHW